MVVALLLMLGFSPALVQAQTTVCADGAVQFNLATYNGSVQWQQSLDGTTWTNISGQTGSTLIITPLAVTWYRAEITNGTCNPIWSDTSQVFPAVTPVISVVGNADSHCPDDTLWLSTGNYVSYLWSNGDTNQTTTTTLAGSYTVTATDTNGCALTSAPLPVTNASVPVVDAGADTSKACGDTITLGGNPSASGGLPPYSYSWSPSNQLSSTSASNPQAWNYSNKDYVLTVTDTNGCSASDTVSVTISGGIAGPDSVIFSFTNSIVEWVVPPCVNDIRIQAWGAQGGHENWSGITYFGGLGAYMSGDFTVNPGDTLKVLVGEQGEILSVGGGGGGSFVTKKDNTPLCIAGGGGGASSDQNGVNAVTTTSGTVDGLGAGTPGSNGNGGGVCGVNQNDGGGGGGLLTDGATANTGGTTNGGFGGQAFVNGGAGGLGGRLDNACTADPRGGLGGGGGASCYTVGGGGGGGYSGGAGGQHYNNCVNGSVPRAGGGGGGSYNSGSNQSNAAGVQSGNGMVQINW